MMRNSHGASVKRIECAAENAWIFCDRVDQLKIVEYILCLEKGNKAGSAAAAAARRFKL
jgi:hypothetical protein